MKEKKQARKILESQMSGKLPRDIEERILFWFARYGDNPDYIDVLENIWDEKISGHREDTTESEERFDRYKRLLGFPEDYSADKEVVDRICAGAKKSRTRVSLRRIGLRVAAVLIPALFIAGAAWFLVMEREMPVEHVLVAKARTQPPPVATEEPEVIIATPEVAEEKERTKEEDANEIIRYDMVVSAPGGGHRYIRLPDRSTVLLNGGGQIAFSAGRREVYLTGEAFFKVDKGGDRPFRVKTDHLTVNVTGTEFNVKAWPESGKTQVELISGSIEVYGQGSSTRLDSQREVTFNNNTGSTRLSVKDGTGWWQDPIIFDNETLYQILKKIEGYYGIRVAGKEQIGDHVRYTIKFDKLSSPELIMDVMNELISDAQKDGSSTFEYTREGTGFTVKKIVTDN